MQRTLSAQLNEGKAVAEAEAVYRVECSPVEAVAEHAPAEEYNLAEEVADHALAEEYNPAEAAQDPAEEYNLA